MKRLWEAHDQHIDDLLTTRWVTESEADEHEQAEKAERARKRQRMLESGDAATDSSSVCDETDGSSYVLVPSTASWNMED